MSYPTVDVLTGRVAVVMMDRPLIPLSTWLTEILKQCVDSDLGLQILTPAASRLTLPLRSALIGKDSRWVVGDAASGYHDGLRGLRLAWSGEAFEPVPDEAGRHSLAAPFAGPALGDAPAVQGEGTDQDWQLALTVTMQHPASQLLSLGGALETMAEALTGCKPGGWGAGEPVDAIWDRETLTGICRDRAPRRTWLVAVGDGERPLIGTLLVSRNVEGVQEQLNVGVGYRAGEKTPLDTLVALADALVPQGLEMILAQRRPGRYDLTTPAHWEGGLPVPVGFGLSGRAVQETVGDSSMPAGAGLPAPRRLGSRLSPGVWYEFGEGISTSTWPVFDRLLATLRP